MGIAAALGVGSAVAGIGGALISSNASQNAAQTEANAANQASATQLNMFNQTKATLAPFVGGGTTALSQLMNIFGLGNGTNGTGVGGAAGSGFNPSAALQAVTQAPGYQFGLKQGVTALDQSAAAGGLDLSGGQLQSLVKYGQDYGQQQGYAPYITELNNLTNLGENAAAGTGQLGASAASGAATTQLAAGSALAAGQVQAGNTLGQATTQLLSGVGSSYGSFGQGGSSSIFGASPSGGSLVSGPGYGGALDSSGYLAVPNTLPTFE